jgi:four helix bundle protein
MPKLKRPRAPRQPRYERLTAWQAVHDLTLAIYRETFSWPEEHQQVLADELRTSATAAATAIVLGSMETDARGFRRHLSVAIGKLARVDCAWELVQRLEVVQPERWGEIEAKRDHAERLTRGLYAALGRTEKGREGRSNASTAPGSW